MIDDEKYTNRLYVRTSISIFTMFMSLLLLIFVIIVIFHLFPVTHLLLRGLSGVIIITLLSIYLACSIFASIFCYTLAKKVLHPLVELSNKSIRVAKGDFNVSINEEATIPELQELLHNFNIMVQELSSIETLSQDFVSNVSHEFKTPLSVIHSNVNILENSSLNEEEKQKCLTAITDSTQKLSTLISNVLKLSKLDNQNITLDNKPFRLDEQIRKSILSFTNQLEEKEIELDLDLEDCIFNGDEDFLTSVWDNLISNAIKFSHQKGTLTIKLKKDKTINIQVSDNGIGMDQETTKHIFNRFYQGETSHSKEGNGLGLTIVSKILRIYNASIKVESEINKGTTFTIDFPLNNS